MVQIHSLIVQVLVVLFLFCYDPYSTTKCFVYGFHGVLVQTTTTVVVQKCTSTTKPSNKLFLSTTTRPLVVSNGYSCRSTTTTTSTSLFGQISKDRRKELGLNDEDDEYDLDVALNNNTNPLITKIIAGSFIVTILLLLVFGVLIPYTTVYEDGICNPLANGGRC